MASQRSHFAVSSLLGVGYAVSGIILLNVHPEYALLAAVIVLVSGLLPNIDNGPTTDTAREFTGFIAALVPLAAVEFIPAVRSGGVARITLVVMCAYLLSRIVMTRLLKACTHHRGMIHSIPAAIITFEVVYLLFWDQLPRDRFYLALGALLGYGTHLMLDASSNFELMGAGERKPAVMKVRAPSWFATTMMYSTALLLGWFVASDLYPGLRLSVGIDY